MKPFKCSFLGNDLIPEDAANVAVWQGRPEPKLSPRCFLWMLLSRAGSLCKRVLRFSWAPSVKPTMKEREREQTGYVWSWRTPRQGFLRQNAGERGVVEKVEDRHTGSGHIHLFFVVVRNGAQGWPGICQACRIPAPNTLPASKSSFGPSFYPLCVQRGEKNYFL